ncbi:MAG: 16S rRNA (guanine(966)-N(2))-methyltransferase RsmD [Chlamydiia bacterium]|nr:16S rRNA (guanine(966)-N(2))-methyltransferase RsmD [Chlamydiia bacterium]
MTLKIIGGTFKSRLLKSPRGATTRPSAAMLREALFNICQAQVPGATFLDLFAGSGAVGLEALSRGATHAYFVEKERHAAQCIRENIATLQVQEQATLYHTDYRVALEKMEQKGMQFDLVFVDPPYDVEMGPILKGVVQHKILKGTSLLFAEQRFSKEPPYSSSQLICLESRRFGDAVLLQYIHS